MAVRGQGQVEDAAKSLVELSYSDKAACADRNPISAVGPLTVIYNICFT